MYVFFKLVLFVFLVWLVRIYLDWVFFSLRQLVGKFPDLAPEVSMLCDRAGLALPRAGGAPVRTGGSSVASSTIRSSVSGVSSRTAACKSIFVRARVCLQKIYIYIKGGKKVRRRR